MEMVNAYGRSLLKFNPKNPEQLKAISCWEPCECDAEIILACIHQSKDTGNKMPRIDLKITRPDGKQKIISEYIYIDSEDRWHLRIKEIFEALGIEYSSGELDLDSIVGKFLKVTIKIQKGKKGNPDRNVIDKYLPKSTEIEFKDDKIPDFL